MQFKRVLGTGMVLMAAVAIAPPVTAQPIPPASANACIQRVAEAMVVATRDITVTGGGPVDALKGTQTLFLRNTVTGQTADCRVNHIDGTVLSVQITSQPTRPPQTVPQASINACIQRTAEEMVVATRDIDMTNAGPADGNGVRTLSMRNRVTGQTANCRVNTITNTVISVQMTSPNPNPPRPNPPTSGGRPVPANHPSARSCQASVSSQIRNAFGSVKSINFFPDTTRAFFISNAEEGIRGEGQFAQRTSSHRFSYNCTVNIRNGRVTSASHTLIR